MKMTRYLPMRCSLVITIHLSAIVASLIGADLLILLSDIDGLFTDDPHKNPDAKLIEVVDKDGFRHCLEWQRARPEVMSEPEAWQPS